LCRPFKIGREEVSISSSIGIALSNSDYTEPDRILRDADAAMYRAKQAGPSRIEIFSPQMHREAVTQLRLENDLRKALERNEFLLYYQPIVSMDTETTVGFEALIRWNHPERGLVQPLEFIPSAEDTGQIVSIGKWVLTNACKWMASLVMQAPTIPAEFSVSINVSGIQFAESDVPADVAQALEVSGLAPSRLKLEIVESTLMKNPTQSIAALDKLRNLGVQVMIDDFGTGYSSLSYLSRLPIDALKIDRSFVHEMTANEHSAEIIRCIIAMANALKLGVVAEGVETREQANVLLSLGCTVGQGFLFAAPMPSTESLEKIR
jgi:EAL domain-containing protein (putative c-di-GMP-specific phosphodiesterase class I)